MFEEYPKRRPELPASYQSVYRDYYKANREGRQVASFFAQMLESWMHRRVAADAGGNARRTLEIGAGTLNHLRYEPHAGEYDIVEPMRFLFETSPDVARVRQAFADLGDVPPTARYGRIISIAALEHICNLPEIIARCGLLLDESGGLRVAIPNEGTPLWEFAWRCSTGLQFRLKYNLDYAILMRHEHVNTALEVESVLRYFFRVVECRVFGVSRRWSIYHFLECRSPDLDACRNYLAELAGKRAPARVSAAMG